MKHSFRFRNTFLAGGSLLVLIALLATDPDGGAVSRFKLPMFASTAGDLMWAARGFVALLLVHFSRKALLDYGALSDMSEQLQEARAGSVSSAIVYLAQILLLCALLFFWSTFFSPARAAERDGSHPRSHQYAPTLLAEVARHWGELDRPEYVFGLIEHESCLSWTHSRCWSPTSELRSAWEQGVGFGQITRVWRKDGTIRFDTLSDLRRRYEDLRELSWETIKQRPDLQLRAVAILSRENWDRFAGAADSHERLAFTDVSYNQGAGATAQNRRVCAIAQGCNAARWFGNAERYCTSSTRPLYGGLSACDISRRHPRDVMLVRMPRYRSLVV